MKKVAHALLKVFGWIPIPAFTLKYVLKCLPKKYQKNLVGNFLDAVEAEDMMPEIVQILLARLEENGYKVEEGRKFNSVKEEIDHAMEEVPQLKLYRVYFERWCERKRREAGLPV